MTLCKKLHCDVKSQSPYFTTTHGLYTTCQEVLNYLVEPFTYLHNNHLYSLSTYL
jgi:hypothetical protein